MLRFMTIASIVSAAPLMALADTIVTTQFDGDLDDAAFALENAIIGEGLVIDYVSHVGDMLTRTGADLGLGPSPVGEGAQIFVFCSASVSREVMEADPINIGNCPYGIFVATIDGETVIGHRQHAADTMAPVNTLLDTIVAAAAE